MTVVMAENNRCQQLQQQIDGPANSKTFGFDLLPILIRSDVTSLQHSENMSDRIADRILCQLYTEEYSEL